jgi:hypothetical protein
VLIQHITTYELSYYSTNPTGLGKYAWHIPLLSFYLLSFALHWSLGSQLYFKGGVEAWLEAVFVVVLVVLVVVAVVVAAAVDDPVVVVVHSVLVNDK